MNKKRISIILIGLILILAGCSQNDKKGIKFPKEKNMSFYAVSTQNQLKIPGEVKLVDDWIVVFDLKSDYFFHVFSLNDLHFLAPLVRHGRGPKEEIMVFPYFSSPSKGSFLFQNQESLKLAKIFDMNGEPNLTVTLEIDLPSELIGNGDFFTINDTLYSSIGSFQKRTDFVGFCRKSGRVFDRGNLIPAEIYQTEHYKYSQFVTGLSTLQPSKKFVALIYPDILLFRIYNTTSFILEAEYSMGQRVSDSKVNYLGEYWRIRSTDEYIFALFSEKTPPEIELATGTPKYSDFSSTIHVFDWDGNPVMKLELDRPIFSFDVTPDNKQIIAISITDPDHLLVAEIPWD